MFFISGDSTKEWFRNFSAEARGWSILNPPPDFDKVPSIWTSPVNHAAQQSEARYAACLFPVLYIVAVLALTLPLVVMLPLAVMPSLVVTLPAVKLPLAVTLPPRGLSSISPHSVPDDLIA